MKEEVPKYILSVNQGRGRSDNEPTEGCSYGNNHIIQMFPFPKGKTTQH